MWPLESHELALLGELADAFAELAICPGCGGTVAGTIKHASLRLDAEEEHEQRDRGDADQS